VKKKMYLRVEKICGNREGKLGQKSRGVRRKRKKHVDWAGKKKRKKRLSGVDRDGEGGRASV